MSVSAPKAVPAGYGMFSGTYRELASTAAKSIFLATVSNATITNSLLLELGSLNRQEARTLALAASLIGIWDNVPVPETAVTPVTGKLNWFAET